MYNLDLDVQSRIQMYNLDLDVSPKAEAHVLDQHVEPADNGTPQSETQPRLKAGAFGIARGQILPYRSLPGS